MIRTHLITGFLGVGKTTAILNLLKQKPEDEKWAVLVNEFGEVGVDGAVLQSQGAVVKEIPGGCLCCVSGLPFQIGLNMLIAKEKPDVLLIEPTGLGHPRNILATLSNEHYRDLLSPGANVCILDPRHISDSRYTGNDVWVDQIQLSDVLVANKTDLATEKDRAAFEHLLADSQPAKSASAWTRQGEMDIRLLQSEYNPQRVAQHPHAHDHQHAKDSLSPQVALAENEDILLLENSGQGHFSVGWLITDKWVFSAEKIRSWLGGLDVERAKGIVITDEGPLVINMRDGVLTEMPTRQPDESRIELIAAELLDGHNLQNHLLLMRV
ncbi:MAG: GTP-binding protein [Oceanospirillaceae bacterium]|uniref:CobW family GTP-binding protein n=1 Tax=unclassified Thalassolituus TaxID=2624967 RepID=UPI000C41558C|nr:MULTISPECIES: GTP-binding protein [unclassified Thalassolituus]MBL36284.1 GTP-binding protein [Oceanospirillaceae bacterium]MBS53971.1 GTP-binding protein [Oceanospirillaceae bacterium]|tara:strand:- start:1252 stop:2226 length:975 start_codon:yes stop_codon:yes gene_type:complete